MSGYFPKNDYLSSSIAELIMFFFFFKSYQGAWVNKPKNSKARAVVHFVGGIFVGAAPQLTYRLFLERLSERWDALYLLIKNYVLMCVVGKLFDKVHEKLVWSGYFSLFKISNRFSSPLVIYCRVPFFVSENFNSKLKSLCLSLFLSGLPPFGYLFWARVIRHLYIGLKYSACAYLFRSSSIWLSLGNKLDFSLCLSKKKKEKVGFAILKIHS